MEKKEKEKWASMKNPENLFSFLFLSFLFHFLFFPLPPPPPPPPPPSRLQWLFQIVVNGDQAWRSWRLGGLPPGQIRPRKCKDHGESVTTLPIKNTTLQDTLQKMSKTVKKPMSCCQKVSNCFRKCQILWKEKAVESSTGRRQNCELICDDRMDFDHLILSGIRVKSALVGGQLESKSGWHGARTDFNWILLNSFFFFFFFFLFFSFLFFFFFFFLDVFFFVFVFCFWSVVIFFFVFFFYFVKKKKKKKKKKRKRKEK